MEKTTQGNGHLLLLIDDNAEYVRATKRILERAGHRVITASGGTEGLEIARTQPVELILVDYLMPGMNGEEFVRELRSFNKTVQVILQTGYASELPPAAMLRKLDIQGYHDKGDGPYKLLLWTDVGLQSARTVKRLEQIRSGLNRILDVARDGKPFEELLQGILQQGNAVLGGSDSCLVVLDEERLVVAAGIGRFSRGDILEQHLEAEHVETIRCALIDRKAANSEDYFALPLNVGEMVIGMVHLQEPTTDSIDIQLIQLFAQHATIAINNAKLHELAALDGATGVYNRKFFDRALVRELRIGHRTRRPLAVLSISYRAKCRPAGKVSDLIKRATRSTDVVGFYGEQRFLVVLPNTDEAGARVVVDRIQSSMSKEQLAPDVACTSIGPPPEGAQIILPEDYFRSVASTMMTPAQGEPVSIAWP